MLKVTAELTRQQKFLRDVASRYEAVANYDFAPLLKYSYVWTALRENREKLERSSPALPLDQAKLFRRAYDQLETDVVMSFLDHQLSILNESLELDDTQTDQLQKVLTMDVGRRRLLLADRSLTAAQFVQKIADVSESTERAIVALLTPEQTNRFEQQMNANRDRLIA